jgi:carboxymethylenebutenolidase
MKNVQLHILPGVQHGYMMRGNSKAFDSATYDFSMGRALATLEGLRSAENERQPGGARAL